VLGASGTLGRCKGAFKVPGEAEAAICEVFNYPHLHSQSCNLWITRSGRVAPDGAHARRASEVPRLEQRQRNGGRADVAARVAEVAPGAADRAAKDLRLVLRPEDRDREVGEGVLAPSVAAVVGRSPQRPLDPARSELPVCGEERVPKRRPDLRRDDEVPRAVARERGRGERERDGDRERREGG